MSCAPAGDGAQPTPTAAPDCSLQRRRRLLGGLLCACCASALGLVIAFGVSALGPSGALLPRALSREDLDTAAYPRARCNDGTPGAYYFARAEPAALAAGESADANWLVYLQGGFQCYSNASCDCRARAQPALLSSAGWPHEALAYGVMQQLRGWNVVTVGYCSSDGWLGDGSRPADATNGGAASGASANGGVRSTFEFNGRRILEATLAQLSSRHGLARASRVLIGGCSAGGRGAFANLDHACDLVRASGASGGGSRGARPPRCQGLIDAGWWTEGEPISSQRARGVPSLASVADAAYALYGPAADGAGGAGVCGDCAAAGGGGRCLLGAECARHTRTSYFLAQSQFDSFALGVALGEAPPRAGAPAAGDWGDGGARAAAAAAQRERLVSGWRRAYEAGRRSGEGLTGVFASTCYAHCLANTPDWFTATAGGRTAAAVFESWLATGSESAVDRCADGVAGGLECSGACPFTPVDAPCVCAVSGALCPSSLEGQR